MARALSAILGLALLSSASSPAFALPIVTHTTTPLGGGLNAYDVYLSDIAATSWFVDSLTFTGAIQQQLAFGTIGVSKEADANTFNGLGGYVKSTDTWVGSDWANFLKGSPIDALNEFSLTAGSSAGTSLSKILVAHIVAAGDVQYSGYVFNINTAGMNPDTPMSGGMLVAGILAVPEPAGIVLCALGAIAVGLAGIQKKLRGRVALLVLAIAAALFFAPANLARADDDAGYTKVSAYEVMTPDGKGTYPDTGTFPIKMQGILLNNPADMLNSTANFNSIPFNLGGQWQVFVQSTVAGDRGGVAVFAAQNYGNVPPALTIDPPPGPGQPPIFIPEPTQSFSNTEWQSQVARLNVDQATGHVFQPGDLVEVRAQTGQFFGGKTNVNSAHSTDASLAFELVLLQPAAGLPDPKPLTLSSIWDNAKNQVLFDPARLTGGELYQGELVNLLNVHLAPGATWENNKLATVLDDSGHSFSLHLGLNSDFISQGKTNGKFDVVGIFNQETPSGGPYTGNYELWAMDPSQIRLVGDANGDQQVNGGDYIAWADHFNTAGSYAQGDFNRDGVVNGADYVMWADNYQASFVGGTTPLAVPEPATGTLALIGLTALALVMRRRHPGSAS